MSEVESIFIGSVEEIALGVFKVRVREVNVVYQNDKRLFIEGVDGRLIDFKIENINKLFESEDEEIRRLFDSISSMHSYKPILISNSDGKDSMEKSLTIVAKRANDSVLDMYREQVEEFKTELKQAEVELEEAEMSQLLFLSEKKGKIWLTLAVNLV